MNKFPEKLYVSALTDINYYLNKGGSCLPIHKEDGESTTVEGKKKVKHVVYVKEERL